jgi:hypothetical protein
LCLRQHFKGLNSEETKGFTGLGDIYESVILDIDKTQAGEIMPSEKLNTEDMP